MFKTQSSRALPDVNDFTYVDVVVEGVTRVMARPPEVRLGADGLPMAATRIYNIGHGGPVGLLDFVDTLQRVLVEEGVLPESFDFEAHRELVPMQRSSAWGSVQARECQP